MDRQRCHAFFTFTLLLIILLLLKKIYILDSPENKQNYEYIKVINSNQQKALPFQMNPSKTSSINKIDEFKNLGIKFSNDKVQTHHYENMYGILLAHLTSEKFNFLEIGLGCHPGYTGTSIPLWRAYLPNITYSLLENNAKCAEPYRAKVDNLFLGDQSDFQFLDVVGTTAGPFQVIVDDGGHSRRQQVNSLIGLWPHLKQNGGIYVIEDFYYSFSKNLHYYDSEESSFDLLMQLIVLLNDPTEIEHLQGSKVIKPFKIKEHALAISKELMSIHCYKRACVLIKK